MRNIAILMLLIPGVIAAIGIKLMRDTLFNDFYAIFGYSWIQFTIGLLLFIGGVAFLGGFIVYRDRKKKKAEDKKKENCPLKDA